VAGFGSIPKPMEERKLSINSSWSKKEEFVLFLGSSAKVREYVNNLINLSRNKSTKKLK
jgi:hypothetical protein